MRPPFIPVSPLSAPSHLAFLDTFPSEWRARPAWVGVIATMDKYLSSFSSHRGSMQRSLLQSHPTELSKAVESMALHKLSPSMRGPIRNVNGRVRRWLCASEGTAQALPFQTTAHCELTYL